MKVEYKILWLEPVSPLVNHTPHHLQDSIIIMKERFTSKYKNIKCTIRSQRVIVN